MRRNWLRWTMSISLAALYSVPLGCDRSPTSTASDQPPVLPAGQGPASQPAPPQTTIELGSGMQALEKKASDGDVVSMVTLARTLEGMGASHRAEAHQWYEKAAAKGDSSAKESIRMMDAADAAAAHPAEPAPVTPASHDAAPADSTAASRPAAPGDLGKVRWLDVMGCFDSHDFSTVSQPNYHKPGDAKTIFVGVSTSADKMLTVAASGNDADDIDAVSVVLRIRSHEKLSTNDRVLQAASICDTVTHKNVLQNEMIDWLGQYLRTGKKSDPNFRNGWSISISGTDAEGIADPKKFLGEAVLIEMKK